jgi:hypothetical protein
MRLIERAIQITTRVFRIRQAAGRRATPVITAAGWVEPKRWTEAQS